MLPAGPSTCTPSLTSHPLTSESVHLATQGCAGQCQLPALPLLLVQGGACSLATGSPGPVGPRPLDKDSDGEERASFYVRSVLNLLPPNRMCHAVSNLLAN